MLTISSFCLYDVKKEAYFKIKKTNKHRRDTQIKGM